MTDTRTEDRLNDLPVPLYVLSAYGSLAFPLAAAFIALQVLLPTYYAESSSLTLTTTGLVLLVARLVDMFTDPVVGYLSDRTPAQWGKRRLWVLLASPVICVSTWLLFNPPDTIHWTYLLCWTVVIYVGGTMAIVPFNAWGAELSSNYQERSRITGFRAAFGLFGTLVALSVPAITADSSSINLGQSLTVITWLVLVTLVISVIWATIKVPDKSDIELPDNTFREALILMRRESPFRQLILSFLLNSIGNAIPATLFLLYVTHVLGEPGRAGQLLFLYFICAALSVPVWLRITRYMGKHQTWMTAILLACLTFIWTPLLGEGDIGWFLVIVTVTGLLTGADLILPTAIKADLIEWDTLKTGYRRPGLFFAMWGTATKLAFALAIGIAFPLLELSGFSAAGDNTSSSITALSLMYGIPCIGFKLAALFLMRNYPITEKEHARIREALKARATVA